MDIIVLFLHFEPVNHHFDRVCLVPIQLHAGYNLSYLSIYPHMNESFLANGLKKFLVMPLSRIH